jgi:hypothetical protein
MALAGMGGRWRGSMVAGVAVFSRVGLILELQDLARLAVDPQIELALLARDIALRFHVPTELIVLPLEVSHVSVAVPALGGNIESDVFRLPGIDAMRPWLRNGSRMTRRVLMSHAARSHEDGGHEAYLGSVSKSSSPTARRRS